MECSKKSSMCNAGLIGVTLSLQCCLSFLIFQLPKSADEHDMIIQALRADTEYEITVIAIADEGTSLPSNGVIVRTKPEDSQHFVNVTVPTDLTGEWCLALLSSDVVNYCL